jgi:hypothetical protein
MRKAILAAAMGMLAVPASALAVSGTAPVSGSVGAELSLSVAAPAAMTMTHSTPGTGSAVVTVTSTQPTWTLQISDAAASTPGYLQRATGTGPTALANPLEWKLSTSSVYANLSGTPTTVTTGTLVGVEQVDFRQRLNAAENVKATDTYNLTATYTVT